MVHKKQRSINVQTKNTKRASRHYYFISIPCSDDELLPCLSRRPENRVSRKGLGVA